MFDPARGYPAVVPYLRYRDPAAAIAWLVEVLGATEALHLILPDGRVGHAELVVGAAVVGIGLALGDAPAHDDVVPTRATLRTMTLVFVDDVDAAAAAATAVGGTVIDPPTDQPWGLRQAIVADPEGHLWEPSSHLTDVAPERWGATQLAPLPG